MLVGALAAFSAQAGQPLNEEAATAIGQQIVQRATHGELDAALREAERLRRDDNADLAETLTQLRQTVPVMLAARGRLGAASLSEESHFGGCFHRIYRLRDPAGADLFWDLKFRLTSTGWALDQISIRS